VWFVAELIGIESLAGGVSLRCQKLPEGREIGAAFPKFLRQKRLLRQQKGAAGDEKSTSVAWSPGW